MCADNETDRIWEIKTVLGMWPHGHHTRLVGFLPPHNWNNVSIKFIPMSHGRSEMTVAFETMASPESFYFLPKFSMTQCRIPIACLLWKADVCHGSLVVEVGVQVGKEWNVTVGNALLYLVRGKINPLCQWVLLGRHGISRKWYWNIRLHVWDDYVLSKTNHVAWLPKFLTQR